MNLTKHFTLEEMCISQEASRSGLKNVPDATQRENLRLLCDNILEPLRERIRKPVIVTSGFRSKTINTRIGGSRNSQHCQGQAADIHVNGMPVAEIVLLIRRMGLPYDQLIDEFSAWVHVSYSPRHRRQTLMARTKGGKTEYREI